MKKFYTIICVSVMCMGLAACGGDDTSQDDGSGMMYNVSLLHNPKSLDPQYASDETANTVIANLYSGLMKFDSSGNVVCCNAESYDVSDDETVYTFKLRKDNYWFFDENDDDQVDDDEYFPVTAQDYVFALKRILSPEMQSPYAKEFSCIKGGEACINGSASADSVGVRAKDDYTLEVQLDYPSADFLALMATTAASPCNEEFFLSTRGRYGLDDDSVMSNGAFFVRQWFYDPYGKNNILYMKKNYANSYDDDKIYPSFLSFTIEESASDIRNMFKDAEIDCFKTYNKNSFEKKKYTIDAQQSMTLGLVFNMDDKTASNINFRKSLVYGLDRKSLNEQTDGDVTAAYGIIPPAVKLLGRSYRELSSDIAFDVHDAEKAVQCCTDAKSELNAESFGTIKMIVPSGSVDSSYLHILSRDWQDTLGFYVSIEELSQDDYDACMESGEFQIALYPIKGRYNSGVSVLEQLADTSFIHLSDSAKSAVKELRRCADSSDLVDEFTNAEKNIIEELSYIPVFYKNCYLVAESENQDIVYDSFSGSVDFRIAKHFD